MRKGVLITRGSSIDQGGTSRWSIALSLDTSVLEIAIFMQAFGCYAVIEGEEVRLLPTDLRPAPTARELARILAGDKPQRRPKPITYRSGELEAHLFL